MFHWVLRLTVHFSRENIATPNEPTNQPLAKSPLTEVHAIDMRQTLPSDLGGDTLRFGGSGNGTAPVE